MGSRGRGEGERPKLSLPVKPATPTTRWQRQALPIAALWACALIAYSSSFRTGFPFDNTQAILVDPRVHAVTPENLHLIWTQDYWFNSSTTGLYRPLTTLSYLFNYAVLGNGSNPAGYHWVNFFLHALNMLMVYLVGLAVFEETLQACALAAVWGLHPLLTESVTNIVGRSDLLAGFGVLAGLLCHIRGGSATGLYRTRQRAGWLAALVLAVAIGLLSKESAVVVLAAMLLYDIAFPEGRRARAWGYVALAPVIAVFFYVRGQVLANLSTGLVPAADNPLMGAGFWISRLTAIKVIGKYLWLFLWPLRLSSDYSYNQIPLQADWEALAALAVCCGAVVVAAVFLRPRPATKKSPALFFCIGFFFASLAPTSNIVILIGALMAERFLYLPAVGLAGCFVIGVFAAAKCVVGARARDVAAGLLLLVCGAFAVRTWLRNLDWFDDRTLWTSAARAAPDSFKPHSVLAAQHIGAQPPDVDEAVAEADRSLAILNPLPDAHNTPRPYAIAGACYRLKGDRTAAGAERDRWYRKALAVLSRGRDIDRAEKETIVRLNRERGRRVLATGWPPLYLELGRTFLRLGDARAALEALTYGREIRPDPEFFAEMSAAYRALGAHEQAATTLLEALVVNPEWINFAADLENLYREFDPMGCAVSESGASAKLNLTCPAVHDQLCTASRNVTLLYARQGRRALAAATRQSAIRDLGCPAALFP